MHSVFSLFLGLMCVGIIGFTLFHIYVACANMTTYEWTKQETLLELHHNGEKMNDDTWLFDRGIVENIVEFVTMKKKAYRWVVSCARGSEHDECETCDSNE